MLGKFTGKGGLHGLRRGDFNNFRAYTWAKQKFESGQFFTPSEVCRTMVEMLEIEPNSVVADICCGKGSFYNYLKGCSLYGVEKDKQCCQVAQRAFPEATIQCADMCYMEPIPDCDYIVGNPPFNLELPLRGHPLGNKHGRVLSQALYLERCHRHLKPGGLLAFITPAFNHRQKMLHHDWAKLAKFIKDKFHTVAVVSLPRSTFDQAGARDFPTKILIYQKKAPGVEPTEPIFAGTFTSRMQILKAWRSSFGQVKLAKLKGTGR